MARLHLCLVEGICKNNCVWCAKNLFKPAILSYDTIASFLENNRGEFEDVMIHDMGETLDHPSFPKIVKLLKDHNIRTPQLNTALNPTLGLTRELAEAVLAFKHINIELGGLKNESRHLNVGDDRKSFEDNVFLLTALHRELKSDADIRFKMIINKNNYIEHMLTTPFYEPSTIYVYTKEFYEIILGQENGEALHQEFIARNFDNRFPMIEERMTGETYQEEKHPSFREDWIVGVDGQIYLCMGMAFMKNREYQLGPAFTSKIADLRNTSQFHYIVDRMRDLTATPYCSKGCHLV